MTGGWRTDDELAARRARELAEEMREQGARDRALLAFLREPETREALRHAIQTMEAVSDTGSTHRARVYRVHLALEGAEP